MTDLSWNAAGLSPDAADRRVHPGSDAHKRLFCRMLLDTHDPYRPAAMAWPILSPAARDRLVSLPIWDMAVQVEGRASINVKAYGETVADPLLREAIALNGFEEARHKEVLSKLVAHYGIALAPEPPHPPPSDPEWAFMKTGYSECVDSFFAFGLFALAARSGFFPPELVETFEPVMREEARHILFFVNWVAWHRCQLSPPARLRFDLRRASAWRTIIRERIETARDVGNGDNFTMTGGANFADDLKPRDLIDLCLAENDRRMATLDPRLPRPRFVPMIARIARAVLRR